MPVPKGGQRGGRKQWNSGGMKALLTSGALAMILWLWVMLATPERSSEEMAEAAPEPHPAPPATLKLEPLPTLVPAPDLNRETGTVSSTAQGQRRSPSVPSLRSIQAPPPPPAPRVIQVPAPSGSRPAAVTRSSR